MKEIILPELKEIKEKTDFMINYKEVIENKDIEKYLKSLEKIRYEMFNKIKISNKEIDKECSRLEKKECELINENEHYEYLIYALKTYYDITEEDLEKCIKNDI